MYLIDLLTPARICAGAQASGKKRLLELAAHTLTCPGHDAELERSIYDSLCHRERLGSTGLGQGVAIPHGRLPGLGSPRGAFLQLAQPLPFDADDDRPVDLIFALAVPEQGSEQHLGLLAQLAQMFRDEEFCARLRQSPNNTELFSLLSSWSSARIEAA